MIDWDKDIDRDALEIILVVDSETEGYPVEADRNLWLPESFASKRAGAARYLEEVRADVVEACRHLVRRHGQSRLRPTI